ncbi:hypothetical protein KC360_g4305 [Hortaea werneckii]|nr:hypothetical protein KC325_g7645 [Hortaea werneckii]KAI6993683.1 hypothetical protein KC359_g5009 [Hortaea werneckii]KAI7145637.1 hypothetical protein KC344_g4329 [Hortaea werneckii]KAI7174380.1 hypothetical protein KC360_g4305 [Hortaea werneckii]
MDDVNKAKELIEDIRRARRVDEGGEEDANAADLSNALRMQVPLSEELYSKPTHFILELIQNSDDNKYAPDVLPKLRIVYREDGLLFIGCNEVGFTAENVKAICRIACSTKKVEGSQKGYIGEKGIGFKAVFKVADMVWIKSGALSFAFDKTKPLGMIAPKWSDFPAGGNMDERTMFCFRISEQEHRDIVAAHLLELKPELLIFLRQLKRVVVTLQDKAGKVKRTFSLAREDSQVSGVRLTTLRHIVTLPKATTNEEKFLVFRDTKTGMPREKKRENVTESDVLMAFPVSASMQPVLSDRRTFNYLPIRSYGLPFVLQGDFMLSASREDILQQNKWNDAVVDATSALFAKRVDAFNATDLLKYTWPRYAKSQGNAHGTIFSGFFKRLCNQLRSKEVLQSQAGSLQKPSSLFIVPSDYMDGPKPLVVAPGRLRTYLSPTYRTNDLSELQISLLSPREFFNIVSRYAEFSKQPEVWHVKLAKALLRAGSHYARAMPLIPMSDGKWIAPDKGKFYFPEVAEGMSIPNGIEVAMTSSEVQDPHRRNLFAELGASKLRMNEVFELILNQHKNARHSNKAWSCEQAVEHARFLFSAPSRPRSYSFKDFRLYGSDNKLHVAEDLYMDDTKSTTAMSALFGKSNARIVFIHPRYFDTSVVEVSSGWLKWLKNEVGVNTLPRLTRPGYHISPEFHWLIDNEASSVWLSLLKDNPSFYDLAGCARDVKMDLSMASVRCCDGQDRKLGDVYLPLKAVVEEPYAHVAVPLLDIKQPNDNAWQNLQAIGLRTKPDIAFYLAVLKNMSLASDPLASRADVRKVYEKIQSVAYQDSQLVKTTFESSALVLITSGNQSGWVNLSSCRWDTVAALQLHGLSAHFPRLRNLFKDILNVRNANAVDIVNELASAKDADDPVAKAQRLLIALSSQFSVNPTEKAAVIRIKKESMKVFPIMDAESSVRLRSTKDGDWFVPDRQRLHESFKSKVGFLHLEGGTTRTITTLVELLGLEDRLLTKHVREETQAGDDVVYQKEMTNMVRSKAFYIAQLAQADSRKAVMDQLAAIEIYSASSLSLQWFITRASGTVYGQSEQGFAMTQKDPDRTQITISEHAVAGKSMPWVKFAAEILDACDVKADQEKKCIMVSILSGDEDIIKDTLEEASLLPGMGSFSEEQLNFPTVAGDDHAAAASDSNQTIGMTNMTATASNSHRARELRLIKSTGLSGHSNDNEHVDIAKVSKAGASFSASRLRTVTKGSNHPPVPKDNFNMNDMLRTLPSNRQSTLGPGGQSSSPGESTEYQKDIGFGGEVYIYESFMKEFGITWSDWTSHLREQYDLPAFTEFEGDFADFTIRDPAICKKMTEWLTAAGSEDMKRWAGQDLTYHFEVKATVGRAEDPFSMSNAQLKLAKRYHEGDSDLYVILRVYKLEGDTGVLAYVDPYGLMLNGKLSFEARDGYEVYAS